MLRMFVLLVIIKLCLRRKYKEISLINDDFVFNNFLV